MRWAVSVVLVLSMAGCASLRLGHRPENALERLPVLLVLGGDPLSTRDARRVAKQLGRHLERPVVIASESSLDEKAVIARLHGDYDSPTTGSWDRERCTVGQAAAHALSYDANAHYRVVLRQRPNRIDGELIATTFGTRPGTVRVPIHATGRRPSVATAVATAAVTLTPPPYPLWDGLARTLLARGCPLGALAVYDARLRQRPDSRDIVRAALGRPRAAERPRVVATAPTPPPTEPTPAPTPRASCRTLCELHMVELCNNDRELWNRHRAAWTATPCGQRRDESFLRECYERQWLTGTLQDACVTPCRRADEGRARLLHLLQREGCSRLPPT